MARSILYEVTVAGYSQAGRLICGSETDPTLTISQYTAIRLRGHDGGELDEVLLEMVGVDGRRTGFWWITESWREIHVVLAGRSPRGMPQDEHITLRAVTREWLG
jgi:hypothetical protein